MIHQKHIALIAHDGKKEELLAWAERNKALLQPHQLYATGTTGKLLEQQLHLPIHKFESGPLGGDMQIGAQIVNGKIDVLLFFWDPLESQPHDPDIKALLRIAVVWNIALACNEMTADILITSPLMQKPLPRKVIDYEEYRNRKY